MGNIYSAQNIASYFVYELNEMYCYVNSISLQRLLAEVENTWLAVFGHSAYQEEVHALESGYVVKEVHEAYASNGSNPISLPATEYFLPYGTFQLIERTYSVPAFTFKEQAVMKKIIERFRQKVLKKAS